MGRMRVIRDTTHSIHSETPRKDTKDSYTHAPSCITQTPSLHFTHSIHSIPSHKLNHSLSLQLVFIHAISINHQIRKFTLHLLSPPPTISNFCTSYPSFPSHSLLFYSPPHHPKIPPICFHKFHSFHEISHLSYSLPSIQKIPTPFLHHPIHDLPIYPSQFTLCLSYYSSIYTLQRSIFITTVLFARNTIHLCSFCDFHFKLSTSLPTPILIFNHFQRFHRTSITFYYSLHSFRTHRSEQLISDKCSISTLHPILYALYHSETSIPSIYTLHSTTFKHRITEHLTPYSINLTPISLNTSVTRLPTTLSCHHHSLASSK